MARTLYDFTWSEFCDWYVEMSKDGSKASRERQRPEVARAQRVLVGVLDGIVRLIQPVMPFLAESIWQALNEAAAERGLPKPANGGRERLHRSVADVPGRMAGRRRPRRASAGCRNWCGACAKSATATWSTQDGTDGQRALYAKRSRPSFRALEPFIRQLAGVGSFDLRPGVSHEAAPSRRALCSAISRRTSRWPG